MELKYLRWFPRYTEWDGQKHAYHKSSVQSKDNLLAYIKCLLVDSLGIICRLFSVVATCHFSKIPEIISFHLQIEYLAL